MHLRELRALSYIARASPCYLPSGAASSTRDELLARAWIVSEERQPGSKFQRFSITAAGLDALRSEQIRRSAPSSTSSE
jgi:hypothetical protein